MYLEWQDAQANLTLIIDLEANLWLHVDWVRYYDWVQHSVPGPFSLRFLCSEGPGLHYKAPSHILKLLA